MVINTTQTRYYCVRCRKAIKPLGKGYAYCPNKDCTLAVMTLQEAKSRRYKRNEG